MSYLKLLLTLVLFVAVSYPEPRVGRVDDDDRAPAFSSPEVQMHENGDRVSKYPPYYHPEHSR